MSMEIVFIMAHVKASKRKQNDAYLIAHAAIRKDPFVLLPFLTQSLSNTLTGESYFCTYIKTYS